MSKIWFYLYLFCPTPEKEHDTKWKSQVIVSLPEWVQKTCAQKQYWVIYRQVQCTTILCNLPFEECFKLPELPLLYLSSCDCPVQKNCTFFTSFVCILKQIKREYLCLHIHRANMTRIQPLQLYMPVFADKVHISFMTVVNWFMLSLTETTDENA